MSAEQRQSPRKSLYTGAVLSLAGQPPVEVRAMNISVDGMCVAAASTMPVGAQCTVHFSLPTKTGGRQLCQVQARVVYSVFSRSQGVKVGLHFMSPAEALVKSIDEFVRL